MDLLRIAARVASVRTAVPGGMGNSAQGAEIRLDEETGAHDFTMKEVSRDGDEIALEVSGTTDDGKPFRGTFRVHLQDVVNFGGWDWEPLEGSLPAEPEAVQPILDAVGDEYGLTEDYGDGGEDPGPPSDPGSPYDTLEEKKGLK
jgi:hypothetical protein